MMARRKGFESRWQRRARKQEKQPMRVHGRQIAPLYSIVTAKRAARVATHDS
jgi:hypothetical protein